jgi:hypothetical protein
MQITKARSIALVGVGIRDALTRRTAKSHSLYNIINI